MSVKKMDKIIYNFRPSRDALFILKKLGYVLENNKRSKLMNFSKYINGLIENDENAKKNSKEAKILQELCELQKARNDIEHKVRQKAAELTEFKRERTRRELEADKL